MALASLVLVVLLGLVGAGPHIAVVASMVFLGGMAIGFARDLVALADPGGRSARHVRVDPGARADRRVTRLRSGLAYGRPEGTSLENLRTRLIELIDDQLIAAHQLDRQADPTGARAALGPRLSVFVDDPKSVRDLTRPAELDRILTLIEQL